MVWFRLSAFRPWAGDAQLRAMFFLPDELDLAPVSHVILSSQGRFLASLSEPVVYLLKDGQLQIAAPAPTSLLGRYSQYLKLFPLDEADCLGIGQKPALPPVLLHLTMQDNCGHARAIFARRPTELHYELLQAVGVKYQGGYAKDGSFVALFENRLPVHVHAGALAGYSRTGNCNEFFLNHGEIDQGLEQGLIKASESRIEHARKRGLIAAAELAERACAVCLPMTCQPPLPMQRFGYGDLVPLGFLLKALSQNSEEDLSKITTKLRAKVLGGRQGKLWPFHTGRLTTATDSVLILQALLDPDAIESLEQFSDGQGGYYPQLWSQTQETGRMTITEANKHWCQADFATTCLVKALRAQAGLPALTSRQYLEERFDVRSGLYFANPYLVDLALAQAIQLDPLANDLRHALVEEILASINADHSFGTFDAALSTSFAILALSALGCRGRQLNLCQLRLAEMMEPRTGAWPECIPFYSTFRIPSDATSGLVERPAQTLNVNGSRHELWLYFDTYRIIATAVAVLALHQPSDARHADLRKTGNAHPRYRCQGHEDYIANFALPEYAGALECRSVVQ